MTRVRVVLGITIASIMAALTVSAAAAAAPPAACANRTNNTHAKLQECVTLEGALDHLEALQEISDDNGGNRAAGLPGYLASVEYAESVFAAAGYTVTRQTFQFAYTEENSELVRVSPNPRTFINESEFIRNRFDSGVPEGTATGPLVNVDLVLNPSGPPNTSTSGCDAADWAGFPAGAVALVQRGTCGFNVKVLNAQAAGASAVIVMNEGQPGRTGLVGMIGDATGLTIPAVFATFDAGLNLATTPSSIVTVTVDFLAETRDAYNVIAESTTGNANNVVMAGAHLDSVQAGAGINDNGSGSAAILEVAEQMAKVKPTNKVRFALWGAEESGLLGSEYYVENLAEDEADKIALYLNFDMIASPNYTFGIYDGDNSGATAPPGFIPPGSAQIEDAFERFYTGRDEPFKDTEFSGRSDYGPFIAVGIPAGGLFTGAEVPKTAAEAAIWGGVAGAQLDPCYHQFCDNLRGDGHDVALYAALSEDYELTGNVNDFAFDVNSDAVAYVTLQYGMTTRDVNGVPGNPDFEAFLP
jgi:Zn-dependent M28 family amino/carboxypeptidase